MGRILGIDFGLARVGVAASDELGMLAHPVETITVGAGDPLARIAALVAELQVEAVVVGMPRNMDGSRGAAAEKASTFAASLRAQLPCPVHEWDERMSTLQAERALRETGRTAKTMRKVVDQAAAQVILQSWLDARP
jgi:putative Holliday junction resolvase